MHACNHTTAQDLLDMSACAFRKIEEERFSLKTCQ